MSPPHCALSKDLDLSDVRTRSPYLYIKSDQYRAQILTDYKAPGGDSLSDTTDTSRRISHISTL